MLFNGLPVRSYASSIAVDAFSGVFDNSLLLVSADGSSIFWLMCWLDAIGLNYSVLFCKVAYEWGEFNALSVIGAKDDVPTFWF